MFLLFLRYNNCLVVICNLKMLYILTTVKLIVHIMLTLNIEHVYTYIYNMSPKYLFQPTFVHAYKMYLFSYLSIVVVLFGGS